ncbi:MAG: hypothetical protein LRY73_09285 [Bacillus sp. (in: Bacteria)]|nr:hypothetical protein [Bacillus sp. (in: firmicutes)]
MAKRSICQTCKQTWTWWQTVNSGFTLDTALECPICGSNQYLTIKTRKRIFWYTLPVYFLIPISISLNIPFAWGIVMAVSYGAFIIVLSPLYVELTDEEQMPWFPFSK